VLLPLVERRVRLLKASATEAQGVEHERQG
jgi:hypothetical protein